MKNCVYVIISQFARILSLNKFGVFLIIKDKKVNFQKMLLLLLIFS